MREETFRQLDSNMVATLALTGPLKSSLELIELSSINKISLVLVSFCSDTGSIRDDRAMECK